MRKHIIGLFIIVMFLFTYGLAMADSVCKYSSSSGSGANLFKYCISSHGNVVEFTSPSGQTHIHGSEGYVLCETISGATALDGFDAGVTPEFGCGSATVNSTSPLTITRHCGNCIQFKQQFKKNNAEKELVITMTIKNTCSSTLTNVRIARYFDGDIGGDSSEDIYSTSEDSVWGRDTQAPGPPGFGLMLTALTSGTSHRALIETFVNWNPGGIEGQAGKCDPTFYGLGNLGPADLVGRILYSLGDLGPDQSKTVKVVYGRK